MPMSSSISSLKRGGAALSRLLPNWQARPGPARHTVTGGCRQSMIVFFILAIACASAADDAKLDGSALAASQAAAERCARQLKSLEDFAASAKAGQKQTTRFSENEVNSYLALTLSVKYHPSLKRLVVSFEQQKLEAVAVLDFDRLRSGSAGVLPRIIGALFSGEHTLAARGQILSGNGKAHFELDQAKFDGSDLPNFLVEQIITAVGQKQKPPFDPLKPSQLPYKIQSVEVITGYVMVYQ
jgi:hypothetical protein